MSGKYPMLYVESMSENGKHFTAYEIRHRGVWLGQEKLTDILDELYKLREESHERKSSKEVT